VQRRVTARDGTGKELDRDECIVRKKWKFKI
jgi:hypothetical protein